MADRPDGSHICSCGDCSKGFEDRCKHEGMLIEIHGMIRERLDEDRPRISPLFMLSIGEKIRETIEG